MSKHLSHLIILLKKLGIAFLIFTIGRVLFYAFNSTHFTQIPFNVFFYGIRFDVVSISYLYLPVIILQLFPSPYRDTKWYQGIIKSFFHLGNFIGLFFNLIDVAYYNFSFKRATSDLFQFVATGNDFVRLIPQFISDYWYLIVLFLGLISFSEFLYRKANKATKNYPQQLKDYAIHSLIFLLFSGITILGLRGGIQFKPLNIINAGQYTNAQFVPLVLNTPFTILRTILETNIEPINYYEDNELEEVYTPEVVINGSGQFKNKNVVIIILESFSREYIGGLNKKEGYTPFLDSLLQESYVFTNAFANGERSIEALPAIFSGIPSLMNTPYINSNYSGNSIDGLPLLLKEKGYNTSFYHGGENGTMRFDGFVSIAGVDNYFGLNEYPNKTEDYDGSWGIFDEPYLQYYANELDQKEEPFFSAVFTLSSHHPYGIPKKYTNTFPKGTLEIHETIGYTDYSLRGFFTTAKTKDWYNNTLFLLTADHSAQASSNYHKGRVGRCAIPLIIYDPTGNLKGKNEKIAQHTDITPTLLHLLGKKDTIISFGNDLFDQQPSFNVTYISGFYQIISNNHLLLFDGENSTALYNITIDSTLNNNILAIDSNTVLKNKLEGKIKAIIQQHNNRLINNRLTTTNLHNN